MSSLYVHIPFCEKKCFYCSFTVCVGQQHLSLDYVRAVGSEIKMHEALEMETVYFGGGTPTSLSAEELNVLLPMVLDEFKISKDCEITIEANPEGINKNKLEIIKKNGINRISLGIQSLDDTNLSYLGRVHKSNEAKHAYNLIRNFGFENINVDFMYGLPIQNNTNIKEDISRLLDLGSEHISLYSLNIEEKSKFYANKVCLFSGERQAEQYLFAKELLLQAGFQQYEVSNFAKEKKESKHNLNYWMCGNYLGLGVGAHSHFNGRRFWNTSNMRDYIKRINDNNSPEDGFEEISSHGRLKEKILFGLRMNKGVNLKECEEEFNNVLSDDFCEILQVLIGEGYIIKEENNVRASEKGFLVLDEICSKLI